jgi:hypothetical protein
MARTKQTTNEKEKMTKFMEIQRVLKTNKSLTLVHYKKLIDTCNKQIEKRKQFEIDKLKKDREDIDKLLKELGAE